MALFLFYNNASAISDYSLSVSTNTTTLESTINTIPDETITIQKHEITINTDNPNGAKVLISSKDNKTTPTYVTGSGPATGSGSTGTSTIAESTGTISTPTKLSPNSFGFALDKNSSTIASNFSTSTIYESINNTDKLTAKFTKLAPNTTPTEIYNKSGSHNNTKLSVYYGTNLNSLMREGKYEMEVLYTVVSGLPTNSIPEENSDDIEIEHKHAVEQAGGYRRTVKTSIKSNAQVAKEDIELMINNKPCTDIEFIQGLTGDITKQLSFTCKVPANEIGKYDIKLKIPKLNINITKTNGIEYIQAMQNFTYNQCTSMTEHQEKTLGDKRDGELYIMAKLKDGKCWMTQNLRYQLSTTRALTPQDSDVQQNWTPNRSTETTLTGRWDQDPEGYKTVRSYYDSTKPQYGTYYTHTAAAAGTTTNMSNDGDEATGSICPKGWRLPRTSMLKANHPINDFYMMTKHYVNDAEWLPNYNGGEWQGRNSLSLPPQNFTYVGYYNGSSAEMDYYNTHARYWYSTLAYKKGYGENYVDRGYFMDIDGYGVTPHAAYGRYFDGNSVRCIAREPQAYDGIKYMQDFTSDICAKMTQHQAVTLKDKRDNQNYIIAKLKDDKCWMTQNLRLKLNASTALTPETSDVQTSWTPTRSTDTSSCSDDTHRWDQDPEGSKTVRSCYNEYQINSYGVYYTRTAATAGTATNMNNNGDEATGSICPKGWRLPKTGTVGKSINNEFYSMARHYIINMPWVDIDANDGHWENGTHNLSSYPQNFFDSGFRAYKYDMVYSNGNWWSSTIHSSDSMYAMTADSDYVNPINEASGHGYSVRCIAR